jgi:putative MATE family efflux protein
MHGSVRGGRSNPAVYSTVFLCLFFDGNFYNTAASLSHKITDIGMSMLDLTENNLNKNIFKLSIPLIIENILHMSVFISDTLMVARLGTAAIAAVGLAGTIFFIISIIFSSLNIGSASIIARHVGAKEIGAAQMVAAQSITLSLLLGILASPFLVLFARKMLVFMSAEPIIVDLGVGYLQIVCGFLVFRLIMLACSGILRGAGDTRTPMKVTLVVNIMNILLNWLLIFGIGPFPGLGVPGVGCATVIAYMVGTGLLLAKLFAKGSVMKVSLQQMTRLHLETFKRIIRISIPVAIDTFLTQMGFMFFTKIVAILGTVSLAAHEIALRIESISFMPGFALAVSTATLVGQSLGAKNINLAFLSMKRSCYFALGLMGFFAVIFLLFPEQITGLFKPENKVHSLATVCLMISAIEQPALAVYMVYAGGLRGAGDTVSPMIVAIVGTLFLHVPLAYFFGITLQWGLAGVWFGAAIDWIIRAVAIYILYKRGRWRSVMV